MISQCANTACTKALLYLDNGRVIRTINHVLDKIEIQHFWLCGDCYVNFDFSVATDGRVSYLRREKPMRAQKEYYSIARISCPALTSR
jgi:hypothetical protein